MKSFIILLLTINFILISRKGYCKEQTVEDLIESVFDVNQELQAIGDEIDRNINSTNSLDNSREQETTLNPNENCKCVARNQCKIKQIKKNSHCTNNYVLCCIETIPTTTPNPNRISTECGIRKPEGIGFRVPSEENEANFGEFPWMVAILYETIIEGNHKFNIYQCGGSLIHPKVVLTAAHCVDNQTQHDSLKIRAGEWDTQTTNELYAHQDRKVQFVRIHDKFVNGRLHNDVALLFLETPVEIAENVNVVCLPPKSVQLDLSKNCIATGWGKDSFGQEGQFQVILKKIELPYVPRRQCLQSLRQTRLGSTFKLHKSFICAGGDPGKDTCKGDGGSPLVCPIHNRINQYQQVGIVSWGIGCGENNTPGVYVNIPYLRDWIDEQMVANNLNESAYIF